MKEPENHQQLRYNLRHSHLNSVKERQLIVLIDPTEDDNNVLSYEKIKETHDSNIRFILKQWLLQFSLPASVPSQDEYLQLYLLHKLQHELQEPHDPTGQGSLSKLRPTPQLLRYYMLHLDLLVQ